MTSNEKSEIFDAHYFAHGCGVPYERNEHWLNFFDMVADRIQRDIQPATVLDAGCALGFLVEMLRDRGIEAWGMDISKYAIENAHSKVEPYVWVGSVTEPFPDRYDLITCIEVLEHLPKPDSEKAVENLCRHADDILFSSTPLDYKETTHFNVQPPEYWAELFARQGFYRDVDFDASFLTAWAVRFRRVEEPVHRLVRDYERKFYPLWKENADLREINSENQTLKSLLDETRERVTHLNRQLVEAKQQEEALKEEAAYKTLLLNDILNSRSWRFMQKVQAVRKRLIPEGSFQEKILLGRRKVDQVEKEPEKDEPLEGERSLGSSEVGVRVQVPHLIRRTMQTWKDEGFRVLLRRVLTVLRARTKRQLPSFTYQDWIKDHEPNKRELIRQQESVHTFTYQPLISVLTPVFNPEPEVFEDTIQSVLSQTYPYWELCMSNGGDDPRIRETLGKFTNQDGRIRVLHLEQNLGIAENSNQALEMAQGEFVLLLDHDDLLAPDTLYEVVKVINQDPTTEIIYFDEDKISADGKVRHQPWFKPSHPSTDLLLSTNYMMHSVIRRSLVDECGGFDPEVDGAQDWDLILKLMEQPRKIVHIPRVFYHWRQVEGSAARNANAKPWAFEAQKRCIETHLARIGISGAEVAFPSLGQVRVHWPVSGKLVSIIIPTKNNTALLQKCLESIFDKTTYPNYEIVLVDNHSTNADTHAYYEAFKDDPRVKIVAYDEPFNYHRANNLGARNARGEFLLLLNNDTEVLEPTWLEELTGWAQREEIGIVGARLIRPDGSIQHNGIIMGMAGHGSHVFDGDLENQYGYYGSTEWYRNFQATTGACLMIRKEVYEQLDGLDEGYRIGYGDIDLCLRAVQVGYRVVVTPFARLQHHEGATRGFSVPPSDVLRASIKMMPYIQPGDPFYNPNLSYSHRHPTIAHPQDESREARILRIMRDFQLLNIQYRDPGNEISDHLIERAKFDSEGITCKMENKGKRGKPNLLLVTHDLSRSGAPIILWMLAKYLSGQGYPITILSPSNGPLNKAYTEIGIQVIIHPNVLNDSRVILHHLSPHQIVLANTILAWRVVHSARAFQTPCIWWVHESNYGQDLASRLKGVAAAFATADSVVFPSEATARQYARFTNRDNYLPIHSGVEPIPTDPEMYPQPFEREPGKLYIANIASIEPRKGQDLLLDAITDLPEEVRQGIECYLIGRTLDKRFRKKITKAFKNLDTVHFIGEASNDLVRSFLASVDVFIMTSRDEALPISLIEAMAFGKAIITTKAGGIDEIITDGVNGLTVEIEDREGLAQKIEQLYRDSKMIQHLGNQAQTTFQEDLTITKFGQQMIQVIRQICQQ